MRKKMRMQTTVTTTAGTENRDASTGQKIDSDIDKEYDERHYASGSGKPDTTIIEANAEGIKCKNYQFAQTDPINLQQQQQDQQ